MAIDATDAAKMRIGAVGVSVDTTLDPATLATTWTSTGGQANRNTLNTAERIITRAINALDGDITNAKLSSDGFAARFTNVVGNEAGADQPAFDALGGNLIQAVHGLVTAPSGGGDAISIRGRNVAAAAPTDGQALAWNQTAAAWTPTTIAGGGNATQIQSRNVASTAPINGQALAWSQSANQWIPTTITGGTLPGDISVNSLQVTGRHPTDWWGLNVHTSTQISGDLSVGGGGAFCGSQFNMYPHTSSRWPSMYLSIGVDQMYLSGQHVSIYPYSLTISGQYTYFNGNDVGMSPGRLSISGNETLISGGDLRISSQTYISGSYGLSITAPLNVSGGHPGMYLYSGSWSMGGPPSYYYNYGAFSCCGSMFNVSNNRWQRTIYMSGNEIYISGQNTRITNSLNIGATTGISGELYVSGWQTNFSGQYLYMNGGSVSIYPDTLSISGNRTYISGGDLNITASMSVSGFPGMYLYPGSYRYVSGSWNYGQFSVCGSIFNAYNYGYLGHRYTGMYLSGTEINMYPNNLNISGGEVRISGADLRITSETVISGRHLGVSCPMYISGSYELYCDVDAYFAGTALAILNYAHLGPPKVARIQAVGGYGGPVFNITASYGDAIQISAWRGNGVTVYAEEGNAINVTAGNAVKPGGGSWSAPSDSRTKTDVKKYDAGLKELVQLDPISFRYNGRGRIRETGRRFVGLAAEAVEEVMPELVHTVKAKLEYDDEEETDIRMIDPSNLTYATINAFKDIADTLKRIDERLTTLEEKSKDK